ncbi:hypothetical protein I6H48_11120 [Corynebacterium amycolatum]|uniref:Biotin synthase auxiliary protein n=1 Tax=Corynebacterium amycolatum TaxID=43765 RepID=A0AB37G996_CORAY|nr:hypothetical protein [Corynebacterium amycolatum]MCQ9126296.1 hypothetical protein [Corynebacterium amycolatum]MCQ9128015.1 hypothetical protein [Corynebacterium amycolatum]MCQ9142303.1 hypothetical protein [Corynebacterium amycolatum]QPR30616.1 hypothetical protein I6G95_10560 [Corynebacterium amycolatum]QQB82451.1 hypothetical protein I6H48_11120 [Corynebacterium amycolatum]
MQLSKPRPSSPRATRRRKVDSTELLQAMVLGDEPKFDPFTGADLQAGEVRERSYGAKAGLEAPRFCQLCGRRMVVQVRPDGWTASCSRHGEVDSVMLEQR